MIVIIFGLPGSGKTYLATRVAQMLGAMHISSDQMRKEMFRLPAYSPEEKLLVYDEMLRRTKEAAEQGKDVVLDATFYINNLRQRFIREVQKISSVFLIEVVADESVIKERLCRPRTDSDADFNVYQAVKNKWESLSSDKHLVLRSNNENIVDMLEQTFDYLFLKNDKRQY